MHQTSSVYKTITMQIWVMWKIGSLIPRPLTLPALIFPLRKAYWRSRHVNKSECSHGEGPLAQTFEYTNHWTRTTSQPPALIAAQVVVSLQ